MPGDPSRLLYTPAPNYFGSDSFTYTIADAAGATASATVTLTVAAVDDPPVAGNDSVTVNEDLSVSIRARLNDTDPEGDAITVVRFDNVSAHGTIVVSSDPYDFRYVPAANYFGSDTFTYEIEAGGQRATGTVTVTVNPVPDPPVAVADSATTLEGTPVTIAVLANDRDPDGQTFSLYSLSNPSGLNLAISFGTVTYTPAAGFYGSRSFTYRIRDAGGSISAPATVTLVVQMINDPPVAQDDVLSAPEDVLATLNVLANDSDPDGLATVQIGIVTPASHGTLTVVGGVVRYLSALDYSGPDSFTYSLVDSGGLTSSTATVSLTVWAINDNPRLTSDQVTTAEDTAVTIEPLANDTDVETPGDLFLVQVLPPYPGTATASGNSVVYTPPANYHGPAMFSYTVDDGHGGQATQIVYLTVVPVNDPPVAANDSATTPSGDSVTVAVLLNDSDADGDSIAVTSVGAPLDGITVDNGDGTITYTPAAGYSGADSFDYTVSDGTTSATATVSIVVEAPRLSQVSVLALRSIWVETGADVLSGDVVANSAGGPPYLGATELAFGSGITMAAGWNAKGNGVTIATGTTIAADVVSNTLANSGTITGAIASPLSLPVFAELPLLLTATPGTTDVNVATYTAITLAPGVYRDLIVAKKGVVTFSGGVYVFRSIQIAREVDLLFSAPSIVKVEGKMATATMTKIQPAPVSTATAATIVFHIAGINGTNGALASTPKMVEIATENVLKANFYVPNGTLWLQARTSATGAFVGKNVRVGPDVQIALASAW